MSLPTLTISAREGWLDQKDRFSKNIAGNQQKNYTQLKYGQLSYNKGNSKIAPYGVVYMLNTHKEALVPSVYHSFEMIDGEPKFLEYLFSTRKLDRELRKYVSSSARMDGLLNITYQNFEKVELNLPQKYEQLKVKEFLKKLDLLLTLHNLRYSNQKLLFDEYLRFLFANIDDRSELYHLGELADIRTGNKDVKDASDSGIYPFFIRSETIESINTYSYDGEAILIPGEGRIGEVFHYINGKFDYHQRVYKISGFNSELVLPKYIYYYMRAHFKKHALSRSVKATVDSLRLPTIKEFKVKVPEMAVQKQIVTILDNLDYQVKKCDENKKKLIELKKVYLNSLFV